MLHAIAQINAGAEVSPIQAAAEAKRLAAIVVQRWSAFEDEVKRKIGNAKYASSKTYFNFDGYYKGATVGDDIRAYSWTIPKVILPANSTTLER